MHEDGTHRRDTTRQTRVTVHLAGEDVAVSASEHDPARSISAHREDVVRRLLRRGLSPHLLRALLPEFGQVIDRHERC